MFLFLVFFHSSDWRITLTSVNQLADLWPLLSPVTTLQMISTSYNTICPESDRHCPGLCSLTSLSTLSLHLPVSICLSVLHPFNLSCLAKQFKSLSCFPFHAFFGPFLLQTLYTTNIHMVFMVNIIFFDSQNWHSVLCQSVNLTRITLSLSGCHCFLPSMNHIHPYMQHLYLHSLALDGPLNLFPRHTEVSDILPKMTKDLRELNKESWIPKRK